MRYPDGEPPDPDVPYGTTMHDMITLSMVFGIVIGVCLYLVGRHGDVLWMKVWSVCLLALSVGYLGADAVGLIEG